MKFAARVCRLVWRAAGGALWLPFCLIDSMGRVNVNTSGVAGYIDSSGRLVVEPQSGTLSFVHQPAGWDAHWKAVQKNSTVNVMFLGDSITVGQNLTVDTKYSYAELVRAQIQAKLNLPTGAQFWSCSMSNSVQSIVGSPMGAIGGASVNRTFYGWSKLNSNNTTGAGMLQTFTSPWACTALDFIYVDYLSGTFQLVVDTATAGNAFTYSIDGQAPVQGTTGAANPITVNTIGLVNVSGATNVRKVQIYGLASGVHTLSWGGQSVANTLLPLGVTAYPVSNAGVGFQSARIAVGGAAALDYTIGTVYPGDRPSLFSGKVPQCDVTNPTAFTVAPANSGVGTFPNASHKFSVDWRSPYGSSLQSNPAAFTPTLNNGVVFTTAVLNTYNVNGIGVYASAATDASPKLVGVIPLTLNQATGVFTVGALPAGIASCVIAGAGVNSTFAITVTAPGTGPVAATTNTCWSYGAYGFPLGADLAIVQFSCNDCVQYGNSTNYAADTYTRAMVRIIQAMRRGNPNCSVVILISSYPDPYTSDTLLPAINTGSNYYSQFVIAAYGVAQMLQCALVNIHAKWGETTNSQGLIYLNDVHPTQAGHADIAASVLSIL